MPGGHLRYSFLGQAPETAYGDGKGLHASAATLTIATDLVTIVGHGLLDGDAIYLTSLSGTTGVSENIAYFVRDKTADTFKLAATSGGAVIDLTGADGTATVNRLGTYLGVEGDGFSHFPGAEFAEIERQAGIQEAPEVLDSAYNLEGQVRVALYPATAKKIFKFALERTNGELDSYALAHHTGLGTGTTQKSVGTKSSRVSFTAEKQGGNPAILMAIDTKAQVDNPVANPPLAAVRTVLTVAKGYDIVRGFIEPRDDQSAAPAISLVENGLNFTINVDQALQEDGRAPDIDGSPTDPLAMRNIPTGLSAGVPVVTGSFRTNPTNARFLAMIQQLKTGSLHITAFHRTSRLASTVNDLAAGATSLHLPSRQIAGSGVFTTTAAFTADAAFATDLITVDGGGAHGLLPGQAIVFTAGTGTLPGGGLVAGTTYYVIADGWTTTAFKVSATPGGAAVDITTPDGANFTATPTGLFSASHGLRNGQKVTLTNNGGALPTGFATSTTYFVVNRDVDAFALSATPGGTAIAPVGGTGTHTWAQPGAGGIVATDVILFRSAGTPNKVEVATVTAIGADTAKTLIDVTVADNLFTKNGHGFDDGQAVILSSLVGITGVIAGVTYYVRDAAANTFKIALTPGGAAIDITGVDGTCTATPASQVLTIKGRGTGGGTRYAWTAASTEIYTVGIELFVPGFRVERGPLAGGRRDNISEEVTWRADAVAGVDPFMWAVAGSSLYAA